MRLTFVIPREPEKQRKRRGKAVWGTSWDSRPNPSPACRTVRPASAWLAATLTSFPGQLWGTGDPRPALGPPAGSAPEPSPACLAHLLHSTPPSSLASWNPLLGLPAALAEFFLLLPGSFLPTAQHPDTSRSAAERGFIQEAAEQRGKTHLKPASREARGWSVPDMKNQEEGSSRLAE